MSWLFIFHDAFDTTECIWFVFPETKQTQSQSLFIVGSILVYRVTFIFSRACGGILPRVKPTLIFTLDIIILLMMQLLKQCSSVWNLNIVFCCRVIIVCSCLPIPAHASNRRKGKLWANNPGHFLWGLWNALMSGPLCALSVIAAWAAGMS